MKPVVLHPRARAEVAEAISYLNEARPGHGELFDEQLEAALRRIQQLPGIGGQIAGTEFRRWRIKGFSYGVVYREEAKRIWVVAVAHNRRQFHYWLSRVRGK